MSSDLFIPIKFNTSVQLKSTEIGKNIDDILLSKIKNNLENMCSKHGYIKNNSIKIVKRSAGQLVVSHFNGNITYNVQCIAEICNPAHGSVLKCRVKAKNALGLLADGFYDNIPILQIIIPKLSAGMKSEINVENVKVGEEINIEVCGKKFLLYDKYISIIGRAIKDKTENIQNVVENLSEIDERSVVGDENDINDIIEFEEDESDVASNEDSEEDEDADDASNIEDIDELPEDIEDEDIDDEHIGDDD